MMATVIEEDTTHWADGASPVRRMDHIGVMVHDIAAATEWYVSALGFTVTDRWSDADLDMEWAHVERGALRLEFVRRNGLTDPDGSGSGYHHLAVVVADCRAATDGLRESGADVVVEPSYFARHDMDWSFVKDPFGNIVELISYRESATDHRRP